MVQSTHQRYFSALEPVHHCWCPCLKEKTRCTCLRVQNKQSCLCYPIPSDPNTAQEFLPKNALGEFKIHYYSGTETHFQKERNSGLSTNREKPEILIREAFSDLPANLFGKTIWDTEVTEKEVKVDLVVIGKLSAKTSPPELFKLESYLSDFEFEIICTALRSIETQVPCQFHKLVFPDQKREPVANFTFAIAAEASKHLRETWSPNTSSAYCFFSKNFVTKQFE